MPRNSSVLSSCKALSHSWQGQNMVPVCTKEKTLSLHKQSSPALLFLRLFSNLNGSVIQKLSLYKENISLWIPDLPGKHLRLFRVYPTSVVHGDCSPVQSIDSRTAQNPPMCAVSVESQLRLCSLNFLANVPSRHQRWGLWRNASQVRFRTTGSYRVQTSTGCLRSAPSSPHLLPALIPLVATRK